MSQNSNGSSQCSSRIVEKGECCERPFIRLWMPTLGEELVLNQRMTMRMTSVLSLW